LENAGCTRPRRLRRREGAGNGHALGLEPVRWRHSLLDIAERSHVAFDVIRRAADDLLEHSLLEERLS